MQVLNIAYAIGQLRCWPLRLYRINSDAVHHAGIEQQSVSSLFHLITTEKKQAPTQRILPVAVAQVSTLNSPSTLFMANVSTNLDEIDLRAAAKVFEGNDAGKMQATSTVQKQL